MPGRPAATKADETLFLVRNQANVGRISSVESSVVSAGRQLQ